MVEKSPHYEIGYTGDWQKVDDACTAADYDPGIVKDIARGAYDAFKQGRTDAFPYLIVDAMTQGSAMKALESIPSEELELTLPEVYSGVNSTMLELMAKNLSRPREPIGRVEDLCVFGMYSVLDKRDEEAQLSLHEQRIALYTGGKQDSIFKVAPVLKTTWESLRPSKKYEDPPLDTPTPPQPKPAKP